MFPSLPATLLAAFFLILAPAESWAEALLQSRFLQTQSTTPVPSLRFSNETGQLSSTLDSLRGRWVLLNIWATWCGPCAHEMASLDKIQALLGSRNLVVLALAQDTHGQTTVPSFYNRHGIRNLAVALDTEHVAPALFKAAGLPTTILINPRGYETGRVYGEVNWAAAENIAFLNRLLDRP